MSDATFTYLKNNSQSKEKFEKKYYNIRVYLIHKNTAALGGYNNVSIK